MNTKKSETNNRKRKYTELTKTDNYSVKFKIDKSGKRHTISMIKEKLTLITIKEKITEKKSVKNENLLRISRKYSTLREYSLNVKIRNINSKNKRSKSVSVIKHNMTKNNSPIKNFRARACPSFCHSNIKMSTKPLTRPESPILLTKQRSKRKINF